jgi:hypothetical protein
MQPLAKAQTKRVFKGTKHLGNAFPR